MAENQVNIRFATDGADKSARDAKKVAQGIDSVGDTTAGAQSKIVDTTQKSTAAVDKNKRAFEEWQKSRNAARRGRGKAGLATDPEEFFRKEEEGLKKAERAQKADAEAKRRAAEQTRKLKEEQRRLREEQRLANAQMSKTKRTINSASTAMTAGARRMTAFATVVRSFVSPWALVGTAVGFATAALTTWVRGLVSSRQATEDAEAATEQYEERLNGLIEKLGERGAAERAADQRAFEEYLTRQTTAFEKQSTALERNLGLMKAKRQAELEVVSAQAALETARIDADENLSEPEKIEARAAVRERVARQQFEAQQAEIRESVTPAERAEEAAQTAQREAAEAAAMQRARAQGLQQRRVNLRRRTERAGTTRDQFEEAGGEERLNRLRGDEAFLEDESQLKGPGLPRAERARKQLEELERLRRLEQEVSQAPELTPDERAELQELGVDPDTNRPTSGENAVDEAKAAATELEEELPKLAEAVVAATADLAAARELAATREETARTVFEAQQETQATKDTSQISEIERREQEEQEERERKAAADAKQESLDREAGVLAGRITEAVRSAGPQGGRGAEIVETLKKAADALQDGTDDQELRTVLNDLLNASSQTNSATLDKMVELTRELEAQAKEISDLRSGVGRANKNRR